MSIVSTVILREDQQGSRKMYWYRCTDSEGQTHDYGPVITIDPTFDPEAHKVPIAAKIADRLAEEELEGLI